MDYFTSKFPYKYAYWFTKIIMIHITLTVSKTLSVSKSASEVVQASVFFFLLLLCHLRKIGTFF